MDSDTIVGRLATHSDFTVLPAQRDAWLAEIALLKTHLAGLSGSVFMEFSIPRMGRRIDAVLIIGPVVFSWPRKRRPYLRSVIKATD